MEDVRSLLEAPSPAVLTTYRRDRSANVSPVWFRWTDGIFEVVIAEGDVKLLHLARDPRCVLVVFEVVPPFRGLEVRDEPELIRRDVTPERAAIAGRYLGEEGGRALPPRGRRSQASCFDSPPRSRASGICRRSCRRRRLPDQAPAVVRR